MTCRGSANRSAAQTLLAYHVRKGPVLRQVHQDLHGHLVPPASGRMVARVIDRLSDDLRKAYPDMRGLSPRNLKYMRAFAAAWPDKAIVQGALAQILWYHNIALLDKLTASDE